MKHITSACTWIRYAWKEYRLIIIAYLLLFILEIFLYPREFLLSLGTKNGSTILDIIRHEPLVFMPLIIVIGFCAYKFSRRRDLKVSHIITGVIILLAFTFTSSLLLETIYRGASPAQVIMWSHIFMDADKTLFGAYPTFWLLAHLPHWIGRISIFIYNNLTIIMSCWMVALLFYKNGLHFKDFIQKIFLALAICVPIWIIFPSICPAQMYLGNILNQPLSPEISELVSHGPPTPYVDTEIAKLIKVWTDMSRARLATSTFPSMHTIWGIILAYSVARAFRRKAFTALAVCIAILNVIGALYLFQHYAIDILSGIVVALIVIKIRTDQAIS